jgi:dTDP-4-dehydrorhamnose 3,5-epimerase
MKFTQTSLDGVILIDIEPLQDERGMFARIWCQEEFKRAQLSTELSQFSISYNKLRGTLRGMHFQLSPHDEIKVVRCTQGSVYDVVIDLRTSSDTYMKWLGIELNAQNHRMLYITKGVAHGFITLEDNTEMLYQISVPYAPDSASGIRWNDPSFKISWPLHPTIISTRDTNYPDFIPEENRTTLIGTN